MSKGIRRPSMKTPFEAKRVIVAASAAIAMVMGAMSVTSSVSTSSGDSDKGHISSIVGATETSKPESQPVKATGLPSKHTLEVRGIIQQQSAPLYTTAKTSSKTNKDALQVFGTINPVLFMTQMVQLQQPAQPVTADGQPVNDSATDTTTTSTKPTTDTSSDTSSKDSSTASDGSSKTDPTSTTTPSDSDSQPQTQSLTSSQPPASATPTTTP